MINTVVVLVFCLVSYTRANINYEGVESDVQLQCIEHCPLQNRTDLGHYDYACNYECNIEQVKIPNDWPSTVEHSWQDENKRSVKTIKVDGKRFIILHAGTENGGLFRVLKQYLLQKPSSCSKGCQLWIEALSSSCQQVCNGTLDRLSHRELYCVIGCNDAITKYFGQVRKLLGTPPAPALLDNSLEATSLRLEWRFPEAWRARLSCHVQWRYEEIAASWQYCRNATWNPTSNDFLVLGLQPYTKYRFRIALNLGHGHGEPIYSEPSVVIDTLASGIPASPPTHVRAAPLDAHSVSVNWEPGPFPHGPLLSYVLQITENNPSGGHETRSEVKDVPSTSSFYVYRNLQPNRNYTVSIQMRNNFGPGPAATTQVSTTKEIQISENQQPILILGTQHEIFELESLFGDKLHLYHSDETTIEGIGIHINKQLLFISDANGSVWRIPIEQETKHQKRILSPEQMDFFPLDISVDWLNDQLYILGEVKPKKSPARFLIKRCNLDGSGLTVALAGLTKKPVSMEIDPCNGYLFWSIRDHSTGGVYRLDISDISNGIKHESKEEKILNEPNLGAIVVDYTNFRLFVPNQKDNTMLAVALDGREVINIRKNVVKAKLQNVLSLGTVNQKFYWTDGSTVYNEEYHQVYNTYYHNKISHLGRTQYKKILINLNSSQPWPIPLNPPTNLQAVFGTNISKIKWLPPHLLGLQGKGAWQNWSYEISVMNLLTNDTAVYKTNTSTFSLRNLTENTQYLLKVSAFSKSGKGPWSSEFKGSTLEENRNPSILWSGSEGLFKSDTAMESVETLIHKSRMRNIGFTGMSWYQDQLYMVTNNSHVFWYNLTTHKYARLADMDSVGSIGVDWIGKKLYWSNLKQQLIIRSNLNGTQQEPLPILTLAKEISIDSVKAYLYWSREYVVECAHLNGEEKMEYDHLEPFSGKQVMGLTLDMNEKQVYWIVRGSEGSHLFQAPMAGYNGIERIEKTRVALLQRPNMQGLLSYFSNRLLWLQDDRNAVISDLEGKNMATVSGKSISGLNLVYVVDEALHIWPDNINISEEINVIPEILDKRYVKVVGSSQSFNITWHPVENVNYGTVFYEVQIEGSPRNNAAIVTTEPTIRYWREVTPFTRLYVTIRAFTYWATSPQIRAELFSPPSTPSAARNLRTFVVFEHNNSLDGENYISVTFRWDPPLYPNGVLQGYTIKCWYMENEIEIHMCENATKPANETEYIISELKDNEIYFFQVQAFTEIGSGAMSPPISVNSSHESPLPTLLIASSDSIFIDDIDANQNYSLLNGIAAPLEVTYLMRENKIFWVNEIQELFMYHFQSTNKTKIFELRGKPKGLAIDWLERSLYYVEEMNDTFGSVVFKINLNHLDKNYIKSTEIFSTSAEITKIEISPYTKKLYWIETKDGQIFKAMTSNIDGSEKQNFFKMHTRKKRSIFDKYFGDNEDDCNCPYDINVEPTFTIDHSTVNKPMLIFIDSESKEVFTSDKDSCFCDVITNNTIFTKTIPVKRIKSDLGSLYWTSSDGTLYALKRKDANVLSKAIEAKDLMIYGKHMQPYPPKECLSPKQQSNFTPTIDKKSYNFLSLKMPTVVFNSNCTNTSSPTVMYRINCKELLRSEDTPRQFITFDNVFELSDLKPYTKYSVAVAASNHFTKEDEIIFGEPIIFRTAPGAPSKPRNISASVLHPTLAQVNWLPPEELNGKIVHYEIHWLTEGSLSGLRQKGEQAVSDLKALDNNTTILTTLLQKLTPNETYTVWIRAYSETNETSSDSDRVQITTYPEPAIFELINKTSQMLSLSWELTPHIQEYIVEYAPITSTNKWAQAELGEKNEDRVELIIKDLKPKTQYKFRLSLLYDKYPEWYIWPSDSRFTFETLGDRPNPPGIPGIQLFGSNVYKVVWEAPLDNGAPIELYSLEALKLRNFRNRRSTTSVTNRTAWYYSAPSIEEIELNWDQVYNGTENSWIITDLDEKFKYAFRVSALNAYGWSDPSAESTEFDISEAERMSQKNPMTLIIIATFVPLSICVAIVLCFSYMTYSRKCGKQKKIEHVVAVQRGPDVELATLRELPRRGVHSTNILYVSAAPNSEDITMLPHIRRDQITLTKFLGSGAFGEVFEGKAKGVGSEAIETKVAVKTLKKGASDQEKSEFLQEAQLMSHFKHEHILQLLGVCLDNDPQFIIMELMEGGDLLTYLRDSRSGLSTPSLTLLDLLKMCLDVTKGCRYLEEMHFVHRDLACRNCLVSSVESDNRIVKIGDFGLARDIYKNDYYRKEGEGLLPVRWMAPESLLDGVFTCQSDVWAFGVLLWEIMTLGQQPYQARSNLEVLHYVKRGGRLGKPTDCPEDLYKLMLKCWEYEPEMRPTFKYCLEVLDNAHREHLRNPTTAAHSQYISTVPDLFAGIWNAAYFLDENENNSGMSWKSENEDDENKEKTPFLQSEELSEEKEIPKYLELLYEPEQETSLENDGYEIPNHMLHLEETATAPSLTPVKKEQSNGNSIDQSQKENTEVAYSNIQ